MVMNQGDDTGGQPKLLNTTFFKPWEKGQVQGGRGEGVKLLFSESRACLQCCVSPSSPSLRANL